MDMLTVLSYILLPSVSYAWQSGDHFGYNNFSAQLSAESHLLGMLKERYRAVGTLTRPVINSSTAIQLRLHLKLIQILDLDEKSSVLSTMVWEKMHWRDEILTWNPKDYDGIDHVRLPASNLWTPDVQLYNGADDTKHGKNVHTQFLTVRSTGSVLWARCLGYRSKCLVDMSLFPFDEHLCHFILASWSYDDKLVNFDFKDNQSRVHLSDDQQHGIWDITKNFAEKEIVPGDCCNHLYAHLKYSLRLRRKPAFHMQMILFPVVLLGFLGATVFWIPPHRPDRTGVGMSIFAAFCVLLLVVVNSTPPTSTSKLGVLICVKLNVIALATVISVITVKISVSEYPPPKYLKVVFVDFIWLKVCKHAVKMRHQDIESNVNQSARHQPPEATACDSQTPRDQWRIIGKISDRICFILYIISFILCLIFLLPRPRW